MTDDFPKNEQETMIPEDSFVIDESDLSSDEWQDPPSQDDGFSDPEIAHDESEEAVEMQEEMLDDPALIQDGDEEVYEEGDEEEETGRGKSVLFGALAIGLIVIGGAGYMFFGSSVPSAPASLNSFTNKQAVEPLVPVTKTVAEGKIKRDEPTPNETDMSLLYTPGRVGKDPYILPKKTSKVTIGGSTDIIIHDGSSGEMSKTELVYNKPANSPSVKVDPSIVKIEDLPVTPTAVTSAPVSVPAPVVENAELVQLKIANKLLKKEIASFRLSQEQAVPANDGELKKVEARLSARDKELETEKKKTATAEKENVVLQKDVKKLQKQLKEAHSKLEDIKTVVKKAKARKRLAKVKKVEKKKSSKSRRVIAKVPQTTVKMLVPPQPKDFVLRAATPEAAWVAKSKGDTNLQRVVVGDEIQQIGRIIAIRNRNGKWEVVGTKGTLR